ncbi:hypothetical protein [Rhodococcus maanshanensis]|uniref:Uncharacterized protein n=1 Tax=Rhodococcus maanshanensis TaxID=183556 RepID=A0A1H7MTG8_9NOCA|nr:hypothetical protein [Rhodococcus maanshanensis]SEL13887.1 hypothetical protein SAMN05444583_106120 [Rhodococcus maanshanensis]
MSERPVEQPHRTSRLRRAVAASGIVGALGVGSLTGGSLVLGDAPSSDSGTVMAAESNRSSVGGPIVTRGAGQFDVISGGS